jgi:uncharacterized protein (UPF0333 family)
MDNNNFIEVFPNHEHRRLYVLLLILLFVIIAGVFVFYQIRNSSSVNFSNDTKSAEEKLAEENKELVRLSEVMKEAGVGQTSLSESELKSYAEKFNKSKNN